MVDFAGALLPLSYAGGGLLAEHLHTRAAASLFDVSHMGQVMVSGGDAAVCALESITPAALAHLPAGGAKYAVLTNSEGGVVDDCIITNAGEGNWFVVINASRKAADIPLLRDALARTDAGAQMTELNEHALLAVQGPAAAQVVGEIFPAAGALAFMQSATARSNFGDFGDCRISRCGYTGEDGFEISLPAAGAAAAALAEALLTAAGGVCKPAGLGARDSLRIEAGLCLYGSELDEATSPVEANLLWTIPKSRRSAKSTYPGAAQIAAQIEHGAPRRLTGILPQSKTPVRAGATLTHNGNEVGRVTSGVHSPTLSAPVALALVQRDLPADAELAVDVRGRAIICAQTALPFVPHRTHRGN